MNWLKVALVAAWAVLAPVHSVMATAMALVLVDLVCGVWASKKGGVPITSAGLRRTVSKIVIYEIGIVVAYLGEHYLLSEALPLIKLVGSAVAVTELQSILENMNLITGAPIFQTLLTALGSANAVTQQTASVPPTPPVSPPSTPPSAS